MRTSPPARGGADAHDGVGVGVRPADGRGRRRLRLGDGDVEHEPSVRAGGQDVLDGVGALAAGAGRADLRVEHEQRGLEVAARALDAGRGAEVAADRRLLADLDVGDAPCARAERLDRVVRSASVVPAPMTVRPPSLRMPDRPALPISTRARRRAARA